MTKQEYLSALKQRLSAYPQDFQNDILDAFEGHFQEGIANGQSEAEIMENLGSVDEVMDNIRMMNDVPHENKQKTTEDTMEDLRRDLNDLGNGLADTIRSAATSFSQQMNDYAKNRAFMEDNAQQGPIETVRNGEDCDTLRVETLNNSVDVELIAADQLAYQFTPLNNIFASSHADVQVSTCGTTASFTVKDGKARLRIYVPYKIVNVSVQLTSGDFHCEDMTLDDVDLNLVSGSGELEEMTIGQVHIETKSGDISIEKSTIGNGFLSTVSGDIDARDVEGPLMMTSVSGDIDAIHVNAPDIKAKSVSGDVTLRVICDKIVASSISGDIEIESKEKIHEIAAESKSGDIECTVEDDDYTCEVSTSSGDFDNCTHLNAVSSSRRNWIVGNGEGRILLSTRSGDVTLE